MEATVLKNDIISMYAILLKIGKNKLIRLRSIFLWGGYQIKYYRYYTVVVQNNIIVSINI